jgi:hypothetical protein
MTDTILFCGGFFGYASEIKRLLEARGRRVALFDDRPATDSVSKAVIRLAPALMRGKAERYFDLIIEKMRGQPIKDVLMVKAECLSPGTVRRMRAAFPQARFTLYFWDSYRNMPADSRDKAALFDRVLSFDPADVRANPGMIYRPLFFVESFARLPEATEDIDALFVGTMHGDRFQVLERISRSLPRSARFRKILYFPARWLFAVHALKNPRLLWTDQRDFIFKPKTRAELTALMARARIAVDIERPVQCGYTMRTLEVLGSGRKLITTNPEVANAEFYHPGNIAIIDRKAPHISPEFLAAPFHPVAPEIVYRYSLGGWLDDVLPAPA